MCVCVLEATVYSTKITISIKYFTTLKKMKVCFNTSGKVFGKKYLKSVFSKSQSIFGQIEFSTLY